MCEILDKIDDDVDTQRDERKLIMCTRVCDFKATRDNFEFVFSQFGREKLNIK